MSVTVNLERERPARPPQATDLGQPHPPTQLPGEWKIVVLLFLAGLAYTLLFRRSTSVDPDEGIILQGAQRILRGQVLYRDFFSFFTPGSYYLLALLFKVFGSSMLVARTALAVYGGLFPVLTYLLSRRVCSRRVSLITACLVIFTCLPYRFLVLHNWDSTLFAALTVYFAVLCLEGSSWVWCWATGLAASLTLMFEQSKGAGLMLGLAVGFLLVWLADRRRPLFGRRQLFALAAGLALPILLVFAWFHTQAAVSSMVKDWLWPLRHYSVANRVSYGYQNWSTGRESLFGGGSWLQRILIALTLAPCFIVPILPLVAVATLAYRALTISRQHRLSAQSAYYILVSAALTGLLVSAVVVRPDIIHLMYLAPLFYLVLAWVLDHKASQAVLSRSFRIVVRALVAITFGALGMALLLSINTSTYEIVTRRGVLRSSSPDSVVDYTQKHITPGTNLLVYPYLPLYNYLTGTFSPSQYEFLQPGMNTPQQADDLLRQLKADRTAVVLFEPGFDEKIWRAWPATPPSAIFQDRIADYILREYRSCKVLSSPMNWRFFFMVRNDLACPSDATSR
jgi:4-amino-4-deoxy-L-arabinose transferase-like glycosyltransferase